MNLGLRVIRDDGTTDPSLDPNFSRDEAVALYRAMLLEREIGDATTRAVADAERAPRPSPETLFTDVFEEVPPSLRAQSADVPDVGRR